MRFRTICIMVPLVYAAGLGGLHLAEQGRGQPAGRRAIAPAEEISSAGGGLAEPTVEVRESHALLRLVALEVTTPEEVREVIALTESATMADRSALVELALRAGDPLVCGNALRAVGRLGALHSSEELLAMTADTRMRVRQDAVVACGLDGGVESLPYLERILQGDDPTLRSLALEALGHIGGDEAEALVRAVVEGAASGAERVFARVALERM